MWDTALQDRAKLEGWMLVTTFDNGSTHPMWDITPHGGGVFKDAHAALRGVIGLAKQGGTLHQQALKLVVQSRARPSKAKK